MIYDGTVVTSLWCIPVIGIVFQILISLNTIVNNRELI